ncbi:cytochrome P450 [Rhizoctonia solani]|nr:cytochrome P450 [Rhizoctonia solani]
MLDNISRPTLLVTSISIVSVYLALRKICSSSSQLPLPPGPSSYPVIGQLLSVPRSSESRAFINLSMELDSNIISFSFLGQTIIVLNSNEVAYELLEKRSSIHSGRFCPTIIASPNLIGMADFVAFLDTNELWRKQRRAINSRLSRSAVAAFRPSQELEVRRLLARLLTSAADTESISSAMFLQSVYGYELKSTQDPFFVEIVTMNANLCNVYLTYSPRDFLVNLLPWMEYIPDWIPGTGWKQTAYEWRAQKERAMDNPYNWAKHRIITGIDDSSIVSLTYKEVQEMGWSEKDADDFCKNSTLTMLWFIIAMALYPEVQEIAQREINEVVGSNRLPSVTDRPNLPYIERLLTEVVRWHPALPLSVPHICTEENEYKGHRIPKGAIIWNDYRGIVRDERVYKNADVFDPDRYLDPSVPPPPAFGWGLRICPGIHFFKEIFFLEVVTMLATLKIEKCKDENGNEIIPTEATTASSSLVPVPFKVKITPRSEHHAELIRSAA